MTSFVQIPNLPFATALSGTEVFEGVQAGTSVQISVGQILTLIQTAGGAASLVVGGSAVSGGVTGRVLYDANGVLGEYPISGNGTQIVTNDNPTIGTLNVSTTLNAKGSLVLGSSGFATLTSPSAGRITALSSSGGNPGVQLDFSTSNRLTVRGSAGGSTLGSVVASGYTATGGTITTSTPAFSATQTWNNNLAAFIGMGLTITISNADTVNSRLLDYIVNGVEVFRVGVTGTLGLNHNISVGSIFNAPAGGDPDVALLLYTEGIGVYGGSGAPTLAAARGSIYMDNAGGVPYYNTNASTGWERSNTILIGNTTINNGTTGRLLYDNAGVFGEALLTYSAAQLQLGAADAAAPVAQTIRVQGVVGGTSNTTGASLTIKGGAGTGNHTGGSIIFQTAPAGASGTLQNSYATAMSINGAGVLQVNNVGAIIPGAIISGGAFSNPTLTGNIQFSTNMIVTSSTDKLKFEGGSSAGAFQLSAAVDDVLSVYDSAGTGLSTIANGAKANTLYGSTPAIQANHLFAGVYGLTVAGWTGAHVGGSADLYLVRSRGTAVGDYTAVTNGDTLAWFAFGGADGTQFAESAAIEVSVNGAVAANSVPADIRFWTTPASATNAVERMAIRSDGSIRLGTAATSASLSIPGAATIQLGIADAAAPVAQTLQVQSVVAGTSNTAGASLTIKGSKGTGSAAGGSIILQVAPAGGSGTSQNALSTILTLASTKQATLAGYLSITAGTDTAGSQTPIAITQTWNNAGANFTGLSIAITDTAADAASKLVRLSLGGSEVFTIGLDGSTTVGNAFNSATLSVAGIATSLYQTSVGAGSASLAFIKASSTADLGIYFGTGDPTFSAAKGSIYTKTDATTTTTRLWVNTNGSTTWAFLTTSA